MVDPKNNGDCACTGEGGPINSGTGDKYQVETDFVGAPNAGLELRRYCNSQATAGAAAFGVNWSSAFQRPISAASDGSSAEVIPADGRVDAFTKNISGSYAGDPDVTDRLNPVPATGAQTGWQLTRADDSVETYMLAGLLSTITTGAGLVTSHSYDGGNNLTTATGPFGHALTLCL